MTKTSDFLALQRFIIKQLAQYLPPTLTYHGVHHTKDVLAVCKQYINRRKIEGREAILLKTGALVHDLGFLYTYQNHEEKGVALVHEILPQYGFSTEEVSLIAGLILATKVPQEPKTELEKILCDADLDYLGRDDFEPISESLFQELQNAEILNNRLAWDKIQVKFLEGHCYHTDYAKKYRAPNKAARLAEIKKRIE